MELASLRPLYEAEGPFATVYLEGRSPSEDAREELRLRWRALRERLESQQAPEGALKALDDALAASLAGEAEANGRVLVANAGRVVLDAPWDAALGTGDGAVWQDLPDVGSYLREYMRGIRELVVVASQTAATLRQEVVAGQHDPRTAAQDEVQGSAYEQVHKPRGQAYAHNRIQRRADEAVSQNAKDIVERVRKIASEFRPHALVLAGEVKGRQAVRAELPDELARITVETDNGGPGEASGATLQDDLLRIAREENERAAEQRSEQWQVAMSHELAARGAYDVAHTAEMGAMQTLLLEPGVSATREAFLIKLGSQTNATADLVAEGTGLDDGVGAILRYRMTS